MESVVPPPGGHPSIAVPNALGAPGRCRSANVLPLPPETHCPLPALPIYNELSASLFEQLSASAGWHLVLGEGGRADLTVTDGCLRVHIADGGTIWYAVQVSQLPLRLEAGRDYLVSFSTRADRPQPMLLDIAQIGTWYSYCPRTEFALTDDWQTHALRFTMGSAATDPQARFEFNLGHCPPNEVYFRDVTVHPIEREQPA